MALATHGYECSTRRWRSVEPMKPTATRRGYLKQVGSAGLAGISTTPRKNSTASDDRKVAPEELLFPESVVPAGFNSYQTPESIPILETLQAADSRFVGADTAAQGYWRGGSKANPEWVLSSVAIVSDEQLSRSNAERAVGEAYDEYISQYDAETEPFIKFEQSKSRGVKFVDWKAEIFRSNTQFGSDVEPTLIYVDQMRQRFFINAITLTSVFGPHQTEPPTDSLLDQCTT